MNRRELLRAAAAGAAALAGIPAEVWALQQGEELVDFDDLAGFRAENHAATPRVKFFDLRQLTDSKVPDEAFFSFHQTQTMKVDLAAWRLSVGGFVEKPLTFTFDEIKRRPDQRDLAVTIECSGNTSLGVGANGQVSSGVWSGVGLALILRDCGVKPEAREVAFFGLDLERERQDAPDVPHGRSVYLQDALDPNVMLAHSLNGKPLSAERGFPLRVIVPGWYGMTHIKWLNRIEVLDRRYEGTHMARNYHTIRDDGSVIETSISKTQLKSVVARVTRKRDSAGRYAYKITGAAWGGPSPVKSVEVSIDGTAWRAATLGESNGNFAWALWSLDWENVRPGSHTLVSRAIDSVGEVQPTVAERQKTIKSLREDNSQWVRRIVIR